jgi:hypothetical protein
MDSLNQSFDYMKIEKTITDKINTYIFYNFEIILRDQQNFKEKYGLDSVLRCRNFIYQSYRAAIKKVKGQRSAAVVFYADTVFCLYRVRQGNLMVSKLVLT